jgi:hypothetical protein
LIPKLKDRIASIERRLAELEQTIEVQGDTPTVRSIERSLKDLQQGRFRRYDSVESLFRAVKQQ